MKISSTPEPLRPERLQPAGSDARTVASKAGGATPAAPSSEKVELSDMAARLNALENRFGGDFDAKKVEEVRNAIAEGRFKVNPDMVAERLLASVSELLGKKA